MVSLSFGVGYAIGSYLNEKFKLDEDRGPVDLKYGR